MTANMDHKSTREMNLAIKPPDEWGNIFDMNLGNVIPPATLSSVGTRTVAFTLTSDIQTTDQSNVHACKIYFMLVTFSYLFFCDLL